MQIRLLKFVPPKRYEILSRGILTHMLFTIIITICLCPLALAAMENDAGAGPAGSSDPFAGNHNLVILNDTKEKSWNGSLTSRSLTRDLLGALHNASTPILTTQSLWHTMLARQEKEDYQKPSFNYEAENWLLYAIGQTSFFLALPKAYRNFHEARSLPTQTTTQEQDFICGLKMSRFIPTADPFNPEKLPKKRKLTQFSTEVLQQIFVPKADYAHENTAPFWNILLNGHGSHKIIAECSHHTFKEILHFLNNVIKTNVFIYSSCHSGCNENRTVPYTTDEGQPALFNYTIINPATNASMTGMNHKHLAQLFNTSMNPEFLSKEDIIQRITTLFHPQSSYDFDNIPWVRWPQAHTFELLIGPNCTTQIIDADSPSCILVPDNTRALLFLTDCQNKQIFLPHAKTAFLLPTNAPGTTCIKKLFLAGASKRKIWHFVHPFHKFNLQPHKFLIKKITAAYLINEPAEMLATQGSDIKDAAQLSNMQIKSDTPISNISIKSELPSIQRVCIEIEHTAQKLTCPYLKLIDIDKYSGNHNIVKQITFEETDTVYQTTIKPDIPYAKAHIGLIGCCLIGCPVITLLTPCTLLTTLILTILLFSNSYNNDIRFFIMAGISIALILAILPIYYGCKCLYNKSKKEELRPRKWKIKRETLSDFAAQEYRDWFDKIFEGDSDEVAISIPDSETTHLLAGINPT